jgi:hypothetical protein
MGPQIIHPIAHKWLTFDSLIDSRATNYKGRASLTIYIGICTGTISPTPGEDSYHFVQYIRGPIVSKGLPPAPAQFIGRGPRAGYLPNN